MTDPNIEALAQVSSHLLDQLAELRGKPNPPAEPPEPTFEDYYPKDSA